MPREHDLMSTPFFFLDKIYLAIFFSLILDKVEGVTNWSDSFLPVTILGSLASCPCDNRAANWGKCLSPGWEGMDSN